MWRRGWKNMNSGVLHCYPPPIGYLCASTTSIIQVSASPCSKRCFVEWTEKHRGKKKWSLSILHLSFSFDNYLMCSVNHSTNIESDFGFVYIFGYCLFTVLVLDGVHWKVNPIPCILVHSRSCVQIPQLKDYPVGTRFFDVYCYWELPCVSIFQSVLKGFHGLC